MNLPTPCRTVLEALAVVSMAAAGVGPARAQTATVEMNPCGPVATPYQYGPFDYRFQKDRLNIVEVRHFTPGVEALTRGSTSRDFGDDLNYTLLVFPNHARALLTVIRLGERLKSPQPTGLDYPIECYPERAVRFAPDDTVVREIYAEYLRTHGRAEEAMRQADIAVTYAGDNPITHYNLGMLFFRLADYDKALTEAHAARRMGWEKPNLENLLKGVNKWQEPTP